jgi:leucine-rich repeat protein SHOC2
VHLRYRYCLLILLDPMNRLLILFVFLSLKVFAQDDTQSEYTSIEQALLNAGTAKSLNLSDKDLRQLPLEVSKLYNLEEIDLSYNPHLDLPQVFAILARLQHLTKLHLWHDSLTVIPTNISLLQNLEELSLNYNNLTAFPFEACHLRKLKHLDLFGNRISKIELKNDALPSLITIDLCYNKFTRFPKELGNLKNLKRVIIWYNKIEHIPSSIEKLVNVEEINLEHNNLKRLPRELAHLKNLKKLNLRDNKLTENAMLPVYKISSLTFLDLQGNKIASIDADIAALKSLSDFSICDNPLTELPQVLSQLKSIEQLGLGDLHNLNWKNAFSIMADLPNLRRVGMYSMELAKMPDGFEKLQQVTTFWLTYNSFDYPEQNRIKAMIPNAKIEFN